MEEKYSKRISEGETLIKIQKLIRTSIACPSQFDAYDDEDTYYYIRYRWGHLTVNKDAVLGEYILSKDIGGPMDGMMSEEELFEHTKELFDWSEVKFEGMESKEDL